MPRLFCGTPPGVPLSAPAESPFTHSVYTVKSSESLISPAKCPSVGLLRGDPLRSLRGPPRVPRDPLSRAGSPSQDQDEPLAFPPGLHSKNLLKRKTDRKYAILHPYF